MSFGGFFRFGFLLVIGFVITFAVTTRSLEWSFAAASTYACFGAGDKVMTVPAWRGQRTHAADLIRYRDANPPVLSAYRGRQAQALLAGVLLAALSYAVWPQKFRRQRELQIHHIRGPRLFDEYEREEVRSLRHWILAGTGVFLVYWLFLVWLRYQVPAPYYPSFLAGLKNLFEPELRPTSVQGLAIGYGLAAVGVGIWHWMFRTSKAKQRDRLTLGGVLVPVASEVQHFLIGGRTGGGKTQAIQEMLRPIRARGNRAIVADPGGGTLSRFWRAHDVILNPFDARSVRWSPFAEIRADYDYLSIARAAIPDGHGDSIEWHHYAQQLLAQAMRRLREDGRVSTRELLRIVAVADANELAVLLAGSPAAIMTQRGNERMLANTRGVISTYLAAWEFLPEPSPATAFSIRDWVREELVNPGHGDWLYLTYQDNQRALRHLLAMWIELAIIEGLSLTEDPHRRLWYVLDELDSLGEVASLKDGPTKLRKYGGCCIAGLQTIAQPRATYSSNTAQTILSSLSTKLVLPIGDGETAHYFQKELGEREVEREELSESHGRAGDRGSESSSKVWRRHTEWLILASQIQGLPDRHGYLRRAGEADVWEVVVPLVKMPTVAPSFVERR